MPLHHFTRLDHAIDEVHALFDAWDETGALKASLDEDGASVLRLAVHEWVANLVQHAAFPLGPVITVEIKPEARTVQCIIEDSSVGFDFASQVEQQHAILDAPAPSERGRGLLMLITCTEALSFQPAAPGVRQRIAFRVRAGTGSALFEPLFRPEDLADDFSLIGSLTGLGTFPEADAFPGDLAFTRDAFTRDAPPHAGDGAAHALAGVSRPAPDAP